MIKLKNETEIALLREGGRRLASVLGQVAKAVKPGLTSRELDALASKLISDLGDKPSFLRYQPAGASAPYPASLCVSINEEVVHGVPSDRQLEVGDVVSLDLGLNHGGLFTDLAVTVLVIGENVRSQTSNISDVVKLKLINATKEALAAGIKSARPGNTLGDIGAAIEAVAKRNGLGVVRDLGGHGVGKKVHEEPVIANYGKKGTGLKLKAGMVLALEPMFTLGADEVNFMPDGYTVTTADGSLAAHFEHTIVITERGAEILTKE
jgi:methionyl aminopeptidase